MVYVAIFLHKNTKTSITRSLKCKHFYNCAIVTSYMYKGAVAQLCYNCVFCLMVVGFCLIVLARFFIRYGGWVCVYDGVWVFILDFTLFVCFKLGFFCILYDFSMVCNVGLVFIWWECCGSSFFDSLASYDVALWLFCLVCYWVFCGHFLHCLTNNNLFFFW